MGRDKFTELGTLVVVTEAYGRVAAGTLGSISRLDGDGTPRVLVYQSGVPVGINRDNQIFPSDMFLMPLSPQTPLRFREHVSVPVDGKNNVALILALGEVGAIAVEANDGTTLLGIAALADLEAVLSVPGTGFPRKPKTAADRAAERKAALVALGADALADRYIQRGQQIVALNAKAQERRAFKRAAYDAVRAANADISRALPGFEGTFTDGVKALADAYLAVKPAVATVAAGQPFKPGDVIRFRGTYDPTYTVTHFAPFNGSKAVYVWGIRAAKPENGGASTGPVAISTPDSLELVSGATAFQVGDIVHHKDRPNYVYRVTEVTSPTTLNAVRLPGHPYFDKSTPFYNQQFLTTANYVLGDNPPFQPGDRVVYNQKACSPAGRYAGTVHSCQRGRGFHSTPSHYDGSDDWSVLYENGEWDWANILMRQPVAD